MKYLLTLAVLWSAQSYAQCTDAYGNRVSCPTEKDSMKIYENALKVFDYYEHNPAYMKLSSRVIQSEADKEEVFDNLKQARRLFYVIRHEVANMKDDVAKAKGLRKELAKDIHFWEYYEKVNQYVFFQRELENQIINKESAFPLYDVRISPVLVNNYKCVDTTSVYYGDLVNIPMYVPSAVKPVALLTSEEKAERDRFFNKTPENNIVVLPSSEVTDQQVTVAVANAVPVSNVAKKADDPYVFHFAPGEQNPFNNIFGEVPLYFYNQYGSGTIIGFIGRLGFRKIMPSEYTRYAVPNFAKELLGDEEKLKNWFKIQYGQYYYAMLNQ